MDQYRGAISSHSQLMYTARLDGHAAATAGGGGVGGYTTSR